MLGWDELFILLQTYIHKREYMSLRDSISASFLKFQLPIGSVILLLLKTESDDHVIYMTFVIKL